MPFLDPPRIYEGHRAVQMFTFWKIHQAGLFQQVTVEPGKKYRFGGYAHAWSSEQDDGHYSDLTGEAWKNFTFSVGVDLSGGTNPWGESVLWGAGAHIYDHYQSLLDLVFTAQEPVITVYIRSDVLWPFKHCDAYFDGFALEEVVEPPTPPEPPPVNYVVVTELLPPDATLDEKWHVLQQAHADKRTILQSADDAARLVAPGLPGSKVDVWGAERWNGNIVQYLLDRGVEIVELCEFEAEPEPPEPPEPPAGLYIPYGSKMGIHAIAPGGTPEYAASLMAVDAPLPVFKAVDDWGYLRLASEASAGTLMIARKTMPFDGAGGVQEMTLAQIKAAAAQYMNAYRQYLIRQSQYDNGKRLEYIDYLELLNEPDPPSAAGYRNLALLMLAMLDIGETWDLPVKKFACLGLNAGTPEWDEMLAVADTGLLERIAYGGHLLTLHEGVIPFSDPIDKYWPGSIPGAPPVERAGALCGRYRYWLHLAHQRGLYLPLVISEFVSGPDYDPAHAADVIGRLAWYDELVRLDPEVLAFLPFTCGGAGAGWNAQDYSPFLPIFYSYVSSRKYRQNARP